MLQALRPLLKLAVAGLTLCYVGGHSLAAHAQAAAAITNTGRLTFTVGGSPVSVISNTVSTTVQAPAPRTMRLMRLARGGATTATLDSSETVCRSADGERMVASGSIDSFDPTAVPLQAAASVHAGEPVFIDVAAPDSNLDPAVRDTIDLLITTPQGDRETLTIRETGPNTGRFVGFVDTEYATAVKPHQCALSAIRNGTIKFQLADGMSADAPLSAEVLVDPYGYVFKSLDGSVVDGAKVTLVDDATGNPAPVLGDDGVSTYPSTVVTGQTVTDSGGSRYDYQSGQYRFPKVVPGRYRLLVAPPGGLTAPSTAAADAIAVLRDPAGAAYTVGEASFARAFDLAAGADMTVDIPVDSQSTGLSLDKSASVTDASVGDFVQYSLIIHNRDAKSPATSVTVSDLAPRGLRYVKGSARHDGVRMPDPAVTADARTLTFTVGAVAKNGSDRISYVMALGSDTQVGEVVNRAQAFGAAGLASNVAQSTVHVRPALYTDRVTIEGRITQGECDAPEQGRTGVSGVRLLLQDGTFTSTDADGLYHFEGVRPGLSVVQLDADSLPPGLTPKNCGGSSRRAHSDISQFVEAQGGMLARADFQVQRTTPATGPIQQLGKVAEALDDAHLAGAGVDWFSGRRPGVAWLFPAAEHNPRALAVRVAILHLPKQRVELTVNGVAVDPLTHDGDDVSADGVMSVALWRGVTIREGDNLLAARVVDETGKVVAELTRKVHYANKPARAEIVAARSVLMADGMTRPLVAVRFTDASGAPVRAGVMGAFRIAAPYQPAVDLADQAQRKLNNQDQASTWRIAGDDGVALIALAPTTRSGEAVIDLPLPADSANHPTQVRVWLKADRKHWVVVGFGAGTVGFNTLSRHTDPMARTSGRPDFVDGDLAFYAKGRVKGSWLLTLAYDNKRTVDRERGLSGAIDPDRNYTVYGDATVQGADASSQNKVYIRIERRAFYALFGDFQTGFGASELGRYDRTLNGVKFERQGRVLSFAGFAADTAQTHIRDEIQGSGLSGPYQLSRHDIVVGSEHISVETRDAARPDRVLTTAALALHSDYDIDYLTGALSFTKPVLSRDDVGDPNVIVAQYEVESGGAKTLEAGLRAAARLADGRIVAGVTVLHDGQGAHEAATDLVAADLKVRPRADTEIRLEAAASDRDAAGALKTQTAYVVEVEHRSKAVEALAYYRRQDQDFGVGQQALGDAGAQKLGIDGKIHVTSKLSVSGSASHEEYVATGATRDLIDGRIDYDLAGTHLTAGLKFVHDDTAVAGKADSALLSLGAGRFFFDHKLQVVASTDVSLNGEAASLDFPVRHRIGAAYSFSDDLRISLSHEIAQGATFRAETTTGGAELSPWKGAKLKAGLGEQGLADSGDRAFGQFGLSQSLIVTKTWSLDASIDTSTTLAGKTPVQALVNPAFPSAAGGTSYASTSQSGGATGVIVEDFRSVSFGGAYRTAQWSWTGRAEARFGANADTWNISSAYLRRLSAGVTAVAGVRASDTQTTDGSTSGATLVEASLAWRPITSRWSVLDRLELRQDRARGTASGQTLANFGAVATTAGDSSRVVNNAMLNFDSDTQHGRHGIQASLYVGLKYVGARFGDDAYTGFVDVVGLQARYNVTSRIDAGFAAAVQQAWASHTTNYAFGPSIGISPATNTWVSLGWNVVGFHDRDFEATAYTRQGPYVTARLKFDQQSLGSFARLIGGHAFAVRGA